MARILVSNVPAYGVANPSLPLVRELAAAGHQVDYLLGEAFRGAVERCGARLIPYAGYLGGALTSPRQLGRFGRRLFHDLHGETLRLGSAYDLVIAAGMQPRVAELERALDRPVVFAPPVFLQNDRTMRHFAEICTTLPVPARRVMGSARARRALGTVLAGVFGARIGDLANLMGPQSSSLNVVNTSRYHQPFDTDFVDRCLFVGPTPTIARPDLEFPLERLREHAGPVVYATLGTVFNRWIGFFRTIADAYAGTDALVVIAAGTEVNAAAIGPVADNVIVRSFVPQAEVLAESDVCFTHGGFGTATDCVALGVPPVVTPLGADHFFNAHRLAELGAGRVLPRSELTVETVRRAGEQALGTSSGGLGALRDSFREAGGPRRAVAAIEGLL